MTDLTTQTSTQLVGIHNGLNPEKPLKAWKGKKAILIGTIEKLQKAAKPKTDVRTIRAAAIELLCHTDHYEDRDQPRGAKVSKDHKNARSVGLPYDVIIAMIAEEFPTCKTTVACLRWYSVKIRVEELGYEGLRLPQRRPRAKPRAS